MATGETGFADVTFDLISVQYHSLKAGHDYGQYVRDAENAGLDDIAAWRRQQSLLRTAERRPDLLDEQALGKADRKLLEQGRQARNQKASP